MVEFMDAVGTALLRRLQTFAKSIDVNPVSIAHIHKAHKNTSVEIVGILFDIHMSAKGHLVLEIEDVTGMCKVLINKNSAYRKQADLLVKDMVVGVSGKMGDSIVFLNTLYTPNILIPKKMCKRNVKILFVGKDCDVMSIVKKHGITDVIYAQEQLFRICKGVNAIILAHGEVFPHTIEKKQDAKTLNNPSRVEINNVCVSLCSQGLELDKVILSGILTGSYGETYMLPEFDETYLLNPQTELLIIHGHKFSNKKEVGTLCISCDADNFIVDMNTYKVVRL